MKLLLTALIVVTGLAFGWVYLGRPWIARSRAGPTSTPSRVIGGQRPWRRLGAAICFVVSIMFALGVLLVDIPDHPRSYAAYWAVIMLLVLWLCGLAIKDLRHTRDVVARWRAGKGTLDGAPAGSKPAAKDSGK